MVCYFNSTPQNKHTITKHQQKVFRLMNVSELTLNFSSGVPIYRQIVQLLSGKILSGALAPGEKIPSIRDVTAELNVNPNTVAKAYRELELAGLIETRRGMGCFVAERDDARHVLSNEEKRRHLDTLFSSLVTSAGMFGISEQDVSDYLAAKHAANTKNNK